jgi:hypothetical protein
MLTSADAARAAFNAAKFSESERRLLENGFRDPKYSLQVERLVKTIKGPAPKPQPPVKAVSVLSEKQARRIAGINQRLSTETQTLMTVSANVLSSAALKAIIGTAPKITSLSQQTIEPGQALIIRGTDFLPQGSVSFTIGSSSFDAQVSEWTNDLIFAHFPAGVRGVAEMDGNVTVRKQNRILRADAPIHFFPWYEIEHTRSTAMRNQEPYHAEVYFILCLLGQFNVPFCSKYDIYFPDCPSYNFKNGAVIEQLYYESDVWLDWGDDESCDYYIGWDGLPKWTTGRLCEHGLEPGAIYCEVTIKYPRGLSWK